jgi:hypothetical protein
MFFRAWITPKKPEISNSEFQRQVHPRRSLQILAKRGFSATRGYA